MINRPYLLVMTLPCYIDAEGNRSVHELWHKDLVEHLRQIQDLTLVAPLEHHGTGDKTLRIDHATFPGKLSFVDLPPCLSTGQTLRHLPTIAARIWRAIGRADIVHGNAGGWPLSFGWLAIPMAKLRRKFTLTNVESGSWRLGFQRPYRWKTLLEACVYEGLGRLIVNLSDVATFTHAGYRESMLARSRRAHGHVICASWINRANILDRSRAEAIWEAKALDPDRPLRVVFAATLKTSKGVAVLLEAARILDRRGVRVACDIYGDGNLRPDCVAAAATLRHSVTLRMCATLDYGDPFFTMLQSHDLMLVPSLSDEQPRVIYDSFAQALPVIGTNTAGNSECVTDGVNGRLVPVGDPTALADAIEWAAGNRSQLAAMGIKALDVANSLTHDQMHARRAAIVAAAFQAKADQ